MRPKSSLEVATFYTQMGWKTVPVPWGAKGPRISGWNQLRLSEQQLPRYFAGRQNVGVLLGEPSRWLVDVDLDHLLAVELAPEFLPPTDAIFGRASKPRSHWLFYSSQPVRTKQWGINRDSTIVELRSTGLQTVFPGSMHPTGEPIQWDPLGEPATADPELLKATDSVAVRRSSCSAGDSKRFTTGYRSRAAQRRPDRSHPAGTQVSGKTPSGDQWSAGSQCHVPCSMHAGRGVCL